MKQQIIVSGTGGQGILFLTRFFAEAAMMMKLQVLTSEIHGMAMRGGTVVSHVKVGPFKSPLVRAGQADAGLILHKQNLELHRNLIRPGGHVFVNTDTPGDYLSIDASGFALRAGAPAMTNLVLLGFAAIAILPEDGFKMDHRMGDILALPEVRQRMQENKKYLVYFIPQHYIMQGMIADTGGDWKLFNQHHSMAMITDWIFNPFGHLREGHHTMHSGMQHESGSMPNGIVRRLIFLSIEDTDVKGPSDLFSINALRVPQFMVDMEVHTLHLLEIKDLPHGSGWGTVPTPVF